jgi:hypothetical protein
MTDTKQEIDGLRRRLGWEAGGPLAEISNQATGGLVSILSAIVGRLRQSGEGRLSVFYWHSRPALPWDGGAVVVRSVNLLKLAAEAELLRYRCMAARQGPGPHLAP